MADISRQKATHLYSALRDFLLKDPKDADLVAAFEADPTSRSDVLASRLSSLLNDPVQSEQLLAALGHDADERFVTMVTGGHVHQIVNVARLGVLNLTVKRYLYVFKNVAQLVVFLTAVVFVGLVTVSFLWRAQQPAKLNGDFNIAVARFGEIGDDGKLGVTPDSAKISRALANYLDSEYSTTDFGLVVQVGHDRMPLVEEDRQAQKLAQAVNADLVIYGTVLGDDSSARLLPRFWVEPNPNMAEISGQSALEAPIRYEPTKLADSGYLTETLRSNAAVLVLFTKALVSLSGGKLEAAAWSLDQAIKEARSDFRGKEVLYLTGSTIARLQNNYDLALRHAETALELNPEYARACVAMGNVYYDLVAANGDWSLSDLLDQASHWYVNALLATDAAPGAYISEKASVSLGNVTVIRAQQNEDAELFQQAIDHYLRVTLRYEQSQDASYREDIREITATAYFGLGAAYQRQNDPEQAILHYQKCTDVTLDPKIRQRCTDLLRTLQAAG